MKENETGKYRDEKERDIGMREKQTDIGMRVKEMDRYLDEI